MKRSFWVHETGLVDEKAVVGEGTKIWQFCVVMEKARIGAHCNIGSGCFVENDVVIGDRVKIKNNVALYSGVICEDDVFLGPNCVFTNVINPRSFIERKHEFRKTHVKKGASIGANATVICGNTIGRYALVGAGSVVTRDVPDHAIVRGNPARVKGYVCQCGEKLHNRGVEYHCEKCGKHYQRNGISLELEAKQPE